MVRNKGAATEPPVVEEESAVVEPQPGELNEALTNLGEAVERDSGKYDVSEEAHQSALDRMAALGDEIPLGLGTLIPNVRDFLLEVIKARPKPWSATSFIERRDVAAACEQLADGLVRGIIETIATGGKKSVRVLLTKVTLGDDTQIVGKVKTLGGESEDEDVMLLHHARGKHVMLTLASADDHKTDPTEPEAEEPPLPFEAGDGPAGEETDDNLVRTGDVIDVGDQTDCEARVSVKTGMVEALPRNGDSETGWIDVREATPAELAAERDRVADDFESEEEGSDKASDEGQLAEA